MNRDAFDPSKQLLPIGYWVRLVIVATLFFGGIICMFSYSVLAGVCISLCAPIFSKFSGFKEMHKKYKALVQAHNMYKTKK